MTDHLTWHGHTVTRAEREAALGQKGAILWLTGLSGSGKSTLANALDHALHEQGYRSYILDGDNIRLGLNANLGFSAEDRSENIRRTGEVARLFADAGLIVIAAFISPFEADRRRIREKAGDDFIEIYCDCPLEVCEQRDVKGLYRKARAGQIAEFTGISSPYEAPAQPDLALETAHLPLQDCVGQTLELLRQRGILNR